MFLHFYSDILLLCVFLSFVLQSVESVFESQIMMKIGCCKLLEVLYSRLPKEEVYSKNSAINQAFCGTGSAEGNELSKNLLKYVFEICIFLFFTFKSKYYTLYDQVIQLR